MSKPRISVLMTVYNAGQFLVPAINSLLSQTFDNFEAIIIENGSTDGSKQKLLSFNDNRLKIFDFNYNIGRTSALNEALSKAKAEYIAILDADDIASKNRFKTQLDYLNANPAVVLVGSQGYFIDQKEKIIGKFEPPCLSSEAYQSMAYCNVIAHSSAMYRREPSSLVGGYPAHLEFAQDYGLWILLAQTGKVANLQQKLISIREHSDRLTNSIDIKLIKSLEVISCFQKARGLANLDPRSKRLNRCVEALELGHIAKSYKNMGKWFLAIIWFSKALVCDPITVIKKLANCTTEFKYPNNTQN